MDELRVGVVEESERERVERELRMEREKERGEREKEREKAEAGTMRGVKAKREAEEAGECRFRFASAVLGKEGWYETGGCRG